MQQIIQIILLLLVIVAALQRHHELHDLSCQVLNSICRSSNHFARERSQPQRGLQLPGLECALPGSATLRQYETGSGAKDRAGRPLPLLELNDSRWQISGAEGGAGCRVSDLRSTPSAHSERNLALIMLFFNLAQLLMYAGGRSK